MRIWKAIPALMLLDAASANDFNYAYGATAFFGWKYTQGVAVAEKAYKSCIEKTNGGRLTSTGAECIFDCVLYVCGAAFTIIGGGYGVSTVLDGIFQAKETESAKPPTLRARSTIENSYNERLLGEFNSRLMQLHGGDGPFAQAIVPSAVHPHDGFAVRLNVRGDDSTHLHIHTNGTHAMSLFHEADDDFDNVDTHQISRRQGFLDTQNHYYTFSGVAGLKVEWHNINHDPNNADDMKQILTAWCRSNLQPSPILSNADVWDFEACNRAKTATFLYGRLIFELNKPGFNYESITPRGCNS